MKIGLHHLRPLFLAQDASEVWDQEHHWSGETYVNVAAPSGTGKTSFVSILYGLLSDYRGRLQFDQQDARSFSRQQWSMIRQEKLSMMFQDLRLFDQLTCWDNVQLKAELAGAVDRVWIEEAFGRLGLASRMQVLAGTCSQGEKQRVAFIRALVQPFQWILLDEPFSHLDDTCAATMRDMLLEACQQNQAGMIVTSLAKDETLPYHRAVAL